jgi:hypothetical protein
MATTNSLTSEALALVNTFASASEEHVEEVIKALRALPQRMNAKGAATRMKAKHGLTSTKTIKKQRVEKPKQSHPAVASSKGPKRPLNSWMAYRSKHF